MSRLAIGVSPRQETLQGHVSMLISRLRGEWGQSRGIKDLQKEEASSAGGLYWEIFQGDITPTGAETIQKALSDFTFAEMEGIGLPLYLLTHPAAKTEIKVELDGKPLRIGGAGMGG